MLAFSSDIWLVSGAGYLSSNGVYSEQNGTLVNNCGNSLTSNIAFTLSSCGYDVWLGNTRGNRYSNTHQNPTWNNLWNYTFTEVGIYDVKNTIEYVMKMTQKPSVGYIGHSMGSTAMFVLLSLYPHFERHVRPFIAFAPIAYLSHMTSIVRQFAPLIHPLRNLVAPLGAPTGLMELSAHHWCTNPVFEPFCAATIDLLVGYDPYADDPDAIPLVVSKILQMVSTKIYLQYGQFILDGRFHEFDYGSAEANLAAYGRPTAPDYPLERIRSKNMAFFVGNRDSLGDVLDAQKLVSKLRVKLLDYSMVPFADWNHVDFAVNIHANRYLNGRVFRVLDYVINASDKCHTVLDNISNDINDSNNRLHKLNNTCF